MIWAASIGVLPSTHVIKRLPSVDWATPFRHPNVTFVVYHGLPHNITDAVPDRCAAELHRFLIERRA